ncbi:unnamed protein product [Arabidopsis arenosa]|uniref:MATH domain-containing protein n=1 Tax=Arabidopsis arenosa TaxID=38785 RepID=A0A8S2AFC1_ARAAE|nr:unnamed protein product [Arabidopsis arenosa]
MSLDLKMQEKFTWVLENFSSLQDECYSPVFTVAGCNWRLLACPRGVRKNDRYFSVYLDLAPESLPPGWRREVKFSITLVNVWPIANRVLGEPCFFDAKTSNWGFEDFLLLEKLRNKGEGFLVNDRLTIVAEGDSPCHQVAQTTDDAASQEKLDENDDDDDDDASEESTDGDDDDGSEESSDDEDASQEDTDDNDDGVCDISLLNQLMNSLEDASYTEENHGISCNNVVAETEVSNGQSDDAPKKDDDDDEASSLVLNDSDENGSTKEQVKVTRLHLVLEDASQTFKNGGRGLNTVASVMGTCDNVLMEIQQVQETVDINGFEVVSSKVESVRRIFERHPDIAVEFRGKNQHLKNAWFKVDWLEKKLDQLKEKKEEEMSGLARLHEIEENLVILKQKWSDLDALAEKEKAELSATRAAMSFDDFVY